VPNCFKKFSNFFFIREKLIKYNYILEINL